MIKKGIIVGININNKNNLFMKRGDQNVKN